MAVTWRMILCSPLEFSIVLVDRTWRYALESEMRVGGWVSAVGFGSRFILSGDVIYLMVMMGIIALICAASVPSLFFKKCAKCGRRNGIEAPVCKQCGTPFPETKRGRGHGG